MSPPRIMEAFPKYKIYKKELDAEKEAKISNKFFHLPEGKHN